MINGIITAILLVAFLIIAGWAYSSRNRERFSAAAQLPLHEDGACCGRKKIGSQDNAP